MVEAMDSQLREMTVTLPTHGWAGLETYSQIPVSLLVDLE